MIRLGRIIRTHGVNGEIIIRHSPRLDTNTKKWDAFMLEQYPDSYIPFFIESIQDRNTEEWIVKLEEINNPEDAKGWLQKDVFSSPNYVIDLKDIQGRFDLFTGFTLFNGEIKIGKIDSVYMPDTNPIFRILKDGKEILIPAHEDLIEVINDKQRSVVMNLPSGMDTSGS